MENLELRKCFNECINYKNIEIIHIKEKGGKYMKKWLIIGLCIFIFIFSILCGFLINSYKKFLKEQGESPSILVQDNIDDVIDTSMPDVIVSPNAEVISNQKYSKCGHVIVTKDIVPREIINLNKDKVEEFYKDWNIDKFSSNEINISKINYGICDEHYILRESDGYISISCKNDIGEYIFKGLTDISTQYLPNEDLERLKNGIEVVGRENLNKLLEDFE